jgi:hypothetical protein
LFGGEDQFSLWKTPWIYGGLNLPIRPLKGREPLLAFQAVLKIQAGEFARFS